MSDAFTPAAVPVTGGAGFIGSTLVRCRGWRRVASEAYRVAETISSGRLLA